MTKKEIIDKVYDDYLKDYGRVGYIGMNSIEKACKSEFEKNGIEYDHYDVKEALESKSHYNIVNAYVKGYSDTREGMTSSSIRDFMIQYKQGLDAGDIEYKDAEFERVAEIFKRYDKYETFNKESKDAIDGLRKDVDMYLSERSSDKESVQNAYKAINAYIYGDSSFGNLSEQVKDIDPADMKEAFNKVIEDNDYLKSWLSIMENPNRNDCSFILNDEYINPDMRDAFYKSNIKSITLNEGLSNIVQGAFVGTHIEKLYIPGSVKHIGKGAISENTKEIIMPVFLEDILQGIRRTEKINHFDHTSHIVRLQCGDKYAYLPRYVDISKFADLTKTVTDFFTDFCEERPELWKYAEDTIDKEDLAMLEYYDFNAKEAKEYLKRNAKIFALRLIQNKDEERLAKLLKMNIASKQLLKLLLEEAGEMMPTARAYILEMLGNTKTNKSFSI